MSDTSMIHARGLVKRFGEATAVAGIDIDVHKGEAFGFLGPNGAGKSSTMRMIGAVSPVTAGTLRILEMDPATHGPEIRAKLGVVPQADTLDSDISVSENLWLYARYVDVPRAEAKRRAAELLEFAQLTDRAGDVVETLSGGDETAPVDRPLAGQPPAAAAAGRADHRPRPAGQTHPVGPAIFETTGNVFFRLRYSKVYDAVLATPLGSADVAVGEIGFALIRGQLYTVSFIVVMACLGLTGSWWALLAVPATVLIGVAFAAIGFAATTYMRHWADVEMVTVVTMPMFLFSATFFPPSAYGSWAWLVQVSPLYHGVSLVRAANNGVWTSSIVVHVAVLVGLALIGTAISARRVDRLLRK